MNSAVDANILVYAHNSGAPQHPSARKFVEETVLLGGEEQFVLVHQTLFELFAVLTSAALLKSPLSPAKAWGVCEFYLDHSALQLVSYEPPVILMVKELLAQNASRGKRLFDLIFAATLKYHGIERLYTRNRRHFENYDFLEVLDPL